MVLPVMASEHDAIEHECQAAGCHQPGTEVVSQDIWLCPAHTKELLADVELHAHGPG